jgi:uncharacterized membrane protein (UPF0182 family)
MGDLFDEFIRELERRRARAQGRGPRDPGRPADADPADEDELPPRDDDEATDVDDDADADDRPDAEEPTPIRPRTTGGSDGSRAGSSRAGGPPRRPHVVGGPDDGAERPSRFRRVGLGIVAVVVALVLVLAGTVVDLWTDAIWYRSVGFDSVFWTRLGSQVGLFVVALLVSLLVLLGNLLLARKLAPPADPEHPGRIRAMADRWTETQRQAERGARTAGGPTPGSGFPGAGFPGRGRDDVAVFDLDGIPDVVPVAGWVLAGLAVLIAIGVAGTVAGAWTTVQLFVHRVPYSDVRTVTDPIFGRDISFFLFDLPFMRFAQSIVNGLLLASLAVAGGYYLVHATRGGEVFVTRVRVHLAVLAGLYLLSVAFGYQLDKYELVYSTAGVATGVSYTDATARFLAYDVLTLLSGLAAALLVGGAFTRWIWPLGMIVIVWFSASLVLGRIYPEAIQRLTVDPNQYAQEEPYIGNNIKMTRQAFGLDQWLNRDYNGTVPITEPALRIEANTFANARLWDYRPLQTTLDQLQTVRQYYDFHDVDTDRYMVNGQLRQVMLSGRELAIDRNPQATGWVNQRVIYTHGIGVAMVPVNEVTPEGQPRLWVRDLPPASLPGTPKVTEPRIYFGEVDNHYVVAGARQAEFDYPQTAGTTTVDQTTRWAGATGIPLDTTLSRLLFALRFRDLDLLITDQITSQSQLLFHRTIADRLPRIAPFLRYDKDPYLVVDDGGRLVYVQDAYTISNSFPNANGFAGSALGADSGLAQDDFNYIRNSVKITMDAYDGTMHFYVTDPTDPIVRAWQGVFPGLFEPLSSMPAGLVSHLRVPEELFNVQTRMYGRYHVSQTLTFFNNTDRWTIPDPQTNQQSLPTEAYYVVMRMPEEKGVEFLLLQPMIAQSRPNMIAWVAARSDVPNYGQVVTYRFPTDTTIFGPAQIEARIDQDPTISAQISLWNQSGSQVIRGNLIVIPVGESLLYLQPVYLQSTSAAFPEFQKIVVASPTTLAWGNTLTEALTGLMAKQGGGLSPGASPNPTPTPAPGATPGPAATPGPGATSGPSVTPGPTAPAGLPTDVKGLVDYANTHYEAAQAALKNGDFATYGDEMDKVGAALQRLAGLTGTP